MTSQSPALRVYAEAGRDWPALIWRAPPGWRGISSAVLGGGIGPITGWVNAMVHRDYCEPDPVAHMARLAQGFGLGAGGVVGMLTAADVRRRQFAEDDAVRVTATVGLGVPTLAAAPDGDPGLATRRSAVGTINILIIVPVPLSDAALVNTVITVTEAKTQALADAGYRATGTASDAVCVACPTPRGKIGTTAAGTMIAPGPGFEAYGGPRSPWGARVARAVHHAVLAGAIDWRDTNPHS